MKVCVFAGTFDPLTNGHVFVIEKCLECFDKVIVAVGVNVDKKPMFGIEERLSMISRTFDKNQAVEVAKFDGMLVDFMKKRGAKFNVRGIRNEDDYKYETTMERFNRDMYPEMTTVFIPTPKELSHISSSAMRNILELNGDFSAYVPSAVTEYINGLKEKK